MAAQQKFRFCHVRSTRGLFDRVSAAHVPVCGARRHCTIISSLNILPVHTRSAKPPHSRKMSKITGNWCDITYSRRQTILQRALNGVLQQACKKTGHLSARHYSSTGALNFSPMLSTVQQERIRCLGASSSPRSLLVAKSACPIGQTSRLSSNYRGDEEEDQRQRLRGAVVYVPNPLTWLTNKWNLAALRRKFDPGFSEPEFLEGSMQAISQVSKLVAEGKFEELKDLVIDEVIDWLRNFSSTLSETERAAMALDADDIVLIKIRNISLDDKQGNALAFVDSVCFGLKVGGNSPFLVDMGMRFRRDYSMDPPSNWMVAGITHIRLQNLAQ